ncbi:MAG: uncharacterized protein K0R63_634 [Rickettsiales bacterium]|jgi:predicted lipid-binding transport protein (Tim44 family)|nr:uncharacterized protein [Rickettsiales bacterium]
MQEDWFGILFFAAIAAVIFFKLRSILGQHSDEDITPRTPLRPYTPSEEANVVELRPRTPGTADEPAYVDLTRDQEMLDKLPDPIKTNIQMIMQKDTQFRISEFMEGAQFAFDMIIKAFAAGDTKTLEGLLSKEMYRHFADDIKTRELHGETLQTTLVSILSTEITSATMEGKEASITVSFVSEQMSAVRNRAGEVVSGNPSATNKIRDTWTFNRNVTSPNPNWTLVATGAI